MNETYVQFSSDCNCKFGLRERGEWSMEAQTLPLQLQIRGCCFNFSAQFDTVYEGKQPRKVEQTILEQLFQDIVVYLKREFDKR